MPGKKSAELRMQPLLKQTMACNFIKKETVPQVFSCEFCIIFKNTYFEEHLERLLLESHLLSRNKKGQYTDLKFYKT